MRRGLWGIVSNYKGRLACLVWDAGSREVFGKILEHTEVFIFECECGDIPTLDAETAPTDLHMRVCGEEQIAFIPTQLLGRKGSMALCTAPAQIRVERPVDLFFCQCDVPCRLETTALTPIRYDGRCVLISDTGLTQFVSEPIKQYTSVITSLPMGRDEWLLLPGNVQDVVSVSAHNHKLRVRFDRLDRLAVGRLRSLAMSFG